MNLVMASVLLLAMLAFQPTLIYGSKGLASSNSRNGNGKKHSLSAAKLVMSLESDDVLVRAARDTPAAGTSVNNSGAGGSSGGGGIGKRTKNNHNRKLNKNTAAAAAENAPAGERKHLDKKFSATANQQQNQPQQHRGNNNNKSKQRQLLKSQQHQTHGKRSGSKSKAENGDKSQSTCRYAKSAWTECDVKTNIRSRTLTLKKGEANCLPTRTMQKKCKKSCRYEKGSWSECSNGEMTRQDTLKATGSSSGGGSVTESSCEALRTINKKCNPSGGSGAGKQQGKANKERKNKDKASRRAQQQA